MRYFDCTTRPWGLPWMKRQEPRILMLFVLSDWMSSLHCFSRIYSVVLSACDMSGLVVVEEPFIELRFERII